LREGLVYRSTGSWYNVKDLNGDFFSCRIKGKFRSQEIISTNPIAVGDIVDFIVTEEDNRYVGLIHKIHKRNNYIVRKSVNLSKQIHIIAANINQVFLFITLNNPRTHYAFIDRFLVTAKAYHVPVLLLFNKIDSYVKEENDQLIKMIKVYQEIGYKCHKISCFRPNDIKVVSKLMFNKVNMFAGHSGVGKSTLLNAIDPDLDIKTAPISDLHKKGQHTTTFAQMYDLENGSRIIDTPGIKGFGVVDIKPRELGEYFIEFELFKRKCRFNDCIHVDEPGCGIKAAVNKNKISESRYNSYLKLLIDDTVYRFKIS